MTNQNLYHLIRRLVPRPDDRIELLEALLAWISAGAPAEQLAPIVWSAGGRPEHRAELIEAIEGAVRPS